MCGICGIFNYGHGRPVGRDQLMNMADRMAHRGPDAEGYWQDGPVGFGHRRLSVVDLAGGVQPMPNEDSTLWVCCNGEIYNHDELRPELENKGHVFRTRSDTEVLLHLYEQCGPDFVKQLAGMFAFAIWDGRSNQLLLARDRLGIKPLVYCDSGSDFSFASEFAALSALPGIPRDIDTKALYRYLNHEYVPPPDTMLRAVSQVNPGEMIIIERTGVRRFSYWSPCFEPKLELDENDAIQGFRTRFKTAVRRRLMSDVPLGAFLSGGIDSSCVVAVMAELTSKPVQTFSIGFENVSYDESVYARMVAGRFGTDHHEMILSVNHALDVLDKVLDHLDLPLGDISALPTYLVSSLAREHVKVSLSGDGADELFAGYERHLASLLARKLYASVPAVFHKKVIEPWARRLKSGDIKKSPLDILRRFVQGAEKDPSGQQHRWQTFLDQAWLPRILTPEFLEQTRHLDPFGAVVERTSLFAGAAKGLDSELLLEQTLYLPGDILPKVDWMSMAVLLESRVPFLDHELVEYVNRLPVEYKMRRGRGKYLLRKAMHGSLPNEVLTRRKQGFSMPLKQWLKDELHDRVANSFTSPPDSALAFFRPQGLLQMLAAHKNGEGEFSHQVWSVFVLMEWMRKLK